MKKSGSKTTAHRLGDAFFDGHRVAKSDPAKAVIAQALALLDKREVDLIRTGHPSARKRARRPLDRERYEKQVEALLCDLVVVHLEGNGQGLCITRDKRRLTKRTRYAPAHISEKLIGVVDAMVDVRLCAMRMGQHRWESEDGRGTVTTLRPGPKLIELLTDQPLAFEDLTRSPDEEVVVLKAPKRYRRASGELIEYQDTACTTRMREELRHINLWLEQADIEYQGETTVNTSDRRLKRIFVNGSFEQHGRLYGGFWYSLRKQDRADNIAIDGDWAVSLDYGQMSVRLMYAEAGVTPHFVDAYGVPGLERHREGTKKLVGAMLNSTRRLTKIPRGLKKLLPGVIASGGGMRGANIEVLTEAILDFHRPIAHLFHTGQGLKGMFIESEIMVRVLLSLLKQGITALPIHDGLMVSRTHADAAKRAMLEEFAAVTGQTGVVKLD